VSIGAGTEVTFDTTAHFWDRVHAVLLPERLPSEARQVAPADDRVVGIVELEQERLTNRQSAELARATGLPEVDLIEIRPHPEEAEPLAVGDGEIGSHACLRRIRPEP